MKKQLEKMWQEVKTERDELRVQIHLGKAELKDEWEQNLEPKWQEAQQKFEKIVNESEETATEIHDAFSVTTDELRSAYQRIRARLKD